MLKFKPGMIPQTFVVVGCGGTGSRLIPLLAQLIKSCSWIMQPAIHIIDDDVVEEKNLTRQNFISQDIGKPKAEVLANRYSRAYGIPVLPIVKRVVPFNEVGSGSIHSSIFAGDSLVQGNIRAVAVISCVDSMAARKAILNEFYPVWQHGGIFIDGGNEDVFGQVIISNPNCLLYRTNSDVPSDTLAMTFPKMSGMLPVTAEVSSLPFPVKHYMHGADGVSTKSCADLDQTLAINSQVAITILSVVQNLVFSRPLSAARLNITLEGVFPEMLTPHYVWNQSVNSGLSTGEESHSVTCTGSRHPFRQCVEIASTKRVGDYLASLQNAISTYEHELAAAKERERIAQRKAEEEALRKRLKEEAERLAAEQVASAVKDVEGPTEAVPVDVNTGVKRVRKPKAAIPELTPLPPTRLEIPPEFRTPQTPA